jgi:hypothetical protein
VSAQHTPGPWTAKPSPESSHWDWVVQAKGMRLGIDTHNAHGDALLIAAAPDLLASAIDLEIALAQYSTLPADKAKTLHKAIRAAIRKATGAAS